MIVKLCGMTRPEDAAAAAGAGADFVGFVLAPGRRRTVTPEVAREIVLAVAGDVRTVAVFVDEDPAEIRRLRKEIGFDMAQLHGNESPADVTALSAALGGRVIKAFRGVPANSADYGGVVARLFDASVPGSGDEWDWSPVASAPRDRPVMLAGGLRVENLERAVRAAGPDGIDVSSGIESVPGRKDVVLMAELVSVVRSLSGDPDGE